MRLTDTQHAFMSTR